jgi:plasmid stabilization system protein ParE
MQLKWTKSAILDIARLHDFLAPLNADAAAKTVQMLTVAPTSLLSNPFIGRRFIYFVYGTRERIASGLFVVTCYLCFKHLPLQSAATSGFVKMALKLKSL